MASYEESAQSFSFSSEPSSYRTVGIYSGETAQASSSGCGFLPPLSLDQYKLNNDPNPEIIRKRPTDKIRYIQEIQYKFLEPPAAPKPGDLLIKQLPNRQIAPAPPLVVRQAPPKPANPAPVILREAPPQPPPRVGDKLVLVPGKVLPPPDRKVVVERLPAIPPKPQQVFLEKWLGYKQQKRRVVFQPAEADCVLPNPKNLVIQWENPEVEVNRQYKNLGTQQADPAEYLRQHGSSLIRHEEFSAAVRRFGAPEQLAAPAQQATGLPELEGDLQALRLVDLDRAGLSEYRSYLSGLGISFDASKASGSQLGSITSAESSGLISIEQAQATLNNYTGSEKPISENELKAYFDANGDGNVSSEEFASAYTQY